MLKNWLRLSILVFLVQSAQTPLHAQNPAPTTPPAPATPAIVVDAAPTVDATPPQRSSRPLQRLLNSHGMACASNFNNLGCGNFCSEFKFVFGSCRTFFGQSCIPNPPHGYGPGNGYGFDGPQKCCGN